MKRVKFTTLLLSAGALASAVALAPKAHASIIAQYSLDGGVTWTNMCTTCTSNVVAGDFTLTGFGASSNSPGTSSPGDYVLSSDTGLTNGATSGKETIELMVSDSGFMTPTTPPDLNLFSHIGGTVAFGGGDNALSFVSSAGAFTTGTQTVDITGAGSFNSDATTVITSLSAPYTISELYTITLDAGSTINFSASTTLEPVPEPATFALFGAGLLGCALFLGRRRRSAQDQV